MQWTWKNKTICDPLCKNQAKVKQSNSEITSIKILLQALISLWFQSLTWPYSVNIKYTKNIISQNVLYNMLDEFMQKKK